jgi:hypothetical protein
MFLSCAWEVPGSDLARDADYSDRGFLRFFSFRQISWISSSFHSLSNLLFNIVQSFDAVQSELPTAEVNKLKIKTRISGKN